MRVAPEFRCVAYDNGRQCQRQFVLKRLCRKHYKRALRKGGETRTAREVASIKAKARQAKLRAMREEVFGDTKN